ncbi:hypothetical protein PROFUN_08926 [Planoprotostelium fungivorum]|uniref:Enoyl-[acyl-carrier-protein] reductase, mitochondrial n=1 Tax=Planoprotostelium fungivorum TaxID=1890364 RepID=A0A2P6NIP5_9EUKA|nr:hypothetical protein PROFUN_08926 [Planoprotostelium fungivorum]
MRAASLRTTFKSFNAPSISSRGFAAKSSPQALQYTQHGAPKSVLKLENVELPKLKDDQVLVKMVAAPINPADINMIEGVYGKKAQLPAIGGNEGVGIVVEAGPKSSFKPNQHVIPSVAGLGTWRTHGVFQHSDLLAVPEGIKPEYAATVSVNPATALRLLNDFADLKQGDYIIQNGANSAVGFAVIQLAKARGIKTINIVRNRNNYEEVHERLTRVGGDVVVTDEYLEGAQFKRLLLDLPQQPKLALDCVGGKSATGIARTLAPNGTLVTYGGMSRKPAVVPTSLFIFKNIQHKGFWLTKWNEENPDKRQQSMDELFKLISQDKLKIWAEKRHLHEWAEAVEHSQAAYRDRKIVLSFE